MATSVATLQYTTGAGTYSFSPIPQIGIRDTTKRIGETGLGAGNIERSIVLKGKIYGTSYNDTQSKIWALQAAISAERGTLYWNDGTTARVNTTVQPMGIQIPEDWGTYEADYTITFSYIPLSDVHVDAVSATYNGYTFSPIPAMGREYVVIRDTADSVIRTSAKVTITLNGFFDRGSVAANLTEWNALRAALDSDGTLTYGTFTQTVRVLKCTTPPDVGDRRLSYAIVMEYWTDLSAGGVIKMSSSRKVESSYRVAINYIPFLDYAITQQIGCNGQTIVASGYVIADSMSDASAAAETEIAAQFPSGGIEQSRNITERSSDNRVDWSVTVFYAQPVLTGGVYAAGPVF